MSSTRDKVVVAMSGGVDSSVAACLLQQQGYEIVGLFMRTGAHVEESTSCASESLSLPVRSHQGCCSASDAADARFVAGQLGLPFYALNFERDFDNLIDYFADEYAAGRTPNPCVVCNNDFKFGKIVDYADAVGADYIATGHYARIERSGGSVRLLKAVDESKDQSYVLFGVDRRVLDRVLFPIGHLHKSQVRELAAKYGLPNRDKPDSVEICFVPDRDYASVVSTRRPDAFVPGDVVDRSGRVVGRHGGIANYTIGQRRGLGIAAGRPIYVTHIDTKSNTLTVGDRDELLSCGLVADRVSILVDGLGDSFRAHAKIRYLHNPIAATVTIQANGSMRIVFDQPQHAVTPGQAVVLYKGDIVLGGGWISHGISTRESGQCATLAASTR